MSLTAATTRPLIVALIGNPNTGKSTLFNALSGFRALTGNYPGVTVEKKVGKTQCGDRTVHLIDLPGTYSLSPRTLDEMVAVDVLLGRQRDIGQIDVVVCIVDASNLERNLYLVSQVLDVGLRALLVLNMTDVAALRGIQIDDRALSERLGVAVIRTEAHRKRGVDEVKRAILAAAAAAPPERPRIFPAPFAEECRRLSEKLVELGRSDTPYYLLERLLFDVGGWLEGHFLANSPALQTYLAEARQRLAEQGCKVPALEAKTRYQWARTVLQGVASRPGTRPVTLSDKLDRVLTHKFAGLVFFALLMFLVFQAIYTWASPLMDLCGEGQGWVGEQIASVVPPGPLQSLLVDGVVAGVGAVLVFLPQIVILFLFIALLEDCGYMARAAFLMDKLMTKIGLSGKSFVPLMSSFACAVPGVMATRVIENRRDRMTTILVAPLMSCSARQPVYVLMIAAFIPATAYLGGLFDLQGLVLFGMTFLGLVVAIPIAWTLKKTLFRGETPPFVMELPSYKWPSLRIVFHRVCDRAKAFVQRAGTLIFAASVLVWAASYFPGDHTEVDRLQTEIASASEEAAAEVEERDQTQARLSEIDEALAAETATPTLVARLTSLVAAGSQEPVDRESLEEEKRTLEARMPVLDERLGPLDELVSRRNHLRSELQENSFLGRLGKAIEPAVRPLGWDWKIGVGVLASFPAREVIIGTLGTIYSLGGETDENDAGLQSAIRSAQWPDGRPVYSIPVALSIMVFFALCAQCASTLMVIKRETNSWWWAIFTFVYMTALAYVAAFVTYRAGLLFVN